MYLYTSLKSNWLGECAFYQGILVSGGPGLKILL